MTATIHPFPGAGKARSASLRWGLESAETIVKTMLDTADDSLFALAEKTSSDEERKSFFDSMRLLRKNGPKILKEFSEGLAPKKARDSEPVSIESLSLIDDAAVEEGISIARVVGRIEGRADNALWEYGQRIESLPDNEDIRLSFELLRPSVLASAFRDALKAVDVEGPTKMILFKLYERQFVTDGPQLYKGLNQRMEAEGFAARGSRRSPNSQAHYPAPHASFTPGPPSYSLPQNLRSVLSAGGDMPMGGTVSGWQGMGSPGVPGMNGGMPTAFSPAFNSGFGFGYGPTLASVLGTEGGSQRSALISQLLDEIGRDWNPEDVQSLQSLLLPLTRIAVADNGFFGNAQHPARSMIATLLGGQSVADSRELLVREVAEALHSMQVDVSKAERVKPLEPTELLKFLSELRAPRDSAEARVSRARDAAHRQVKAIGSGRDLPDGIARFLTDIWLPMVAAVNLKFGTESPEWATTNETLERLFAQCRWLPATDEDSLVDEIVSDVDRSLEAMSVPPKLIEKAKVVLRYGLESSRGSENLLDLESFRSRKPTASPSSSLPNKSADEPTKKSFGAWPGGSDEWRIAVPVGGWFRVYDRAADRTMWLTAEVIYPQAPTIPFVGFDPSVRLAVSREDLLDDLASGKAEPVYATEAQRVVIAKLCTELSIMRGAPAAQ